MSVEKKIRVRPPSTIKAKFGWMDDYFESEPNLQGATDATGNVGFGMMIEHKNIELNSVYNMHFKEKYVGHQGSLQLKIHF